MKKPTKTKKRAIETKAFKFYQVISQNKKFNYGAFPASKVGNVFNIQILKSQKFSLLGTHQRGRIKPNQHTVVSQNWSGTRVRFD